MKTNFLACALIISLFRFEQIYAGESKGSNTQPKGLTTIATLDREYAPANIAVSQEGRIFLSSHLAYSPLVKTYELGPDGDINQFPDAEFFPPLNGVLGAVVDNQDIFWFLDTIWGPDGLGRVIGWDIRKNKLHKKFYIARPLVGNEYILNDLAVDRTNNAIYISETAGKETSALLVLDISTGLVRRVLEGSRATTSEDIDLVVDGETVKMQGKAARVGVNPITIDVANEWVYFAPMSSRSLYRVRTRDLINEKLSASTLESRVERYSGKPQGDGITIDANNNIYVSDLESNAIGIIDPEKNYHILYQDDNRLSWVEGFANAGGKTILVTANKLHRSPAFNNDPEQPKEFYVLSFPSLGEATKGR